MSEFYNMNRNLHYSKIRESVASSQKNRSEAVSQNGGREDQLNTVAHSDKISASSGVDQLHSTSQLFSSNLSKIRNKGSLGDNAGFNFLQKSDLKTGGSSENGFFEFDAFQNNTHDLIKNQIFGEKRSAFCKVDGNTKRVNNAAKIKSQQISSPVCLNEEEDSLNRSEDIEKSSNNTPLFLLSELRTKATESRRSRAITSTSKPNGMSHQRKEHFHIPMPNRSILNRKKLIEKQLSEEESNLRVKSYVNKKSKQLLKNKRDQVPVEELLIIKGEVSKMKQASIVRQLSEQKIPKITKRAKNLKRSGSVFDRLYSNPTQEKKSKKESSCVNFAAYFTLNSEKSLSQSNWNVKPDSTPLNSRVKKTEEHSESNKPKKLSRTQSDRFFEKNLIWLQKKEEILERERENKQAQELEGCTFYPVTKDYHESNEIREAERMLFLDDVDTRIVLNGKTFDLNADYRLQSLLNNLERAKANDSIFQSEYEKFDNILKNIK